MTTEATVIALKADIQGLQADMRQAVSIVNGGLGQLDRIASTTRTVFGSLLGAAGVLGVGALTGTLREFETLKASLQTVTGSAQAAQRALAWIQPFAATTPFSLEEVTGAFVKLTALGLEPSEEALRSYGNTASALGKTLDQFVEAVADAATGEFERLKEFGIRASVDADRVTFTFRNASTTVAKEAQAIEGYLRQIGQVDFAGAMEERANSLDGALSNLGDSFTQLITAVGDAGLTGALASAARAMATLVSETARAVKESGSLLAAFRGLGAGIAELARPSDQKLLAETELRIDEIERRIVQLRKLGSVGANAEAEVLQREVDRLQRTRQGLLVALPDEAIGAGPAPRRESATSAASGTQTLERPKTTEEKAAEKAAAALARREADAIRQLQLRLVAENEATEAARVRLEIEEGAYRDFSAASKGRLEDLADEVDLQRQSAEVQEYLRGVERQRREDAEKARQALSDERQRTIESLRTPQEAYVDEINRLLSLGLDDTNLQRGIEAARDAMLDAQGAAQATSSAAEDLGITFSSAFEDAIVGANSLRDVIQGLGQDILRIAVRKGITEPLAEGLQSIFGSLGEGGGFFANLFGNARGGLYRVGGSGAEHPIAFTARAGEYVAVGTRMDGGGSGTVVNVYNQAGAEIRTSESVVNGQRQIDVMVESSIGRLRGSGRLNVAGLAPATVPR